MASYVLGYLVAILPLGVLLLKGKGRVFLVAFALTLIPVVGALAGVLLSLRLAKPNSWWARKFYGASKRWRGRDRYPDAPEEPETTLAGLGAIVLFVVGPGLIVVALTLPT